MNHYITKGTTVSEAEAIRARFMKLHAEYNKILDDMFNGIHPETLPWDDKKFRDLFYSRINNLYALKQAARNWDAMKELVSVIGKVARS